jgi:hypothetical protein
MEQVENVFNKLHKLLKCQLIYENNLRILMDTSEDVLMVATENNCPLTAAWAIALEH